MYYITGKWAFRKCMPLFVIFRGFWDIWEEKKLQFILIFPISRKNQLLFWSIARIWRKTAQERAILWPIFSFFCESIQTIYIQSRTKFWDIWTHFSLKMAIFRRFSTPFCLYKTYRKSEKMIVRPSWPSLRKWT